MHRFFKKAAATLMLGGTLLTGCFQDQNVDTYLDVVVANVITKGTPAPIGDVMTYMDFKTIPPPEDLPLDDRLKFGSPSAYIELKDRVPLAMNLYEFDNNDTLNIEFFFDNKIFKVTDIGVNGLGPGDTMLVNGVVVGEERFGAYRDILILIRHGYAAGMIEQNPPVPVIDTSPNYIDVPIYDTHIISYLGNDSSEVLRPMPRPGGLNNVLRDLVFMPDIMTKNGEAYCYIKKDVVQYGEQNFTVWTDTIALPLVINVVQMLKDNPPCMGEREFVGPEDEFALFGFETRLSVDATFEIHDFGANGLGAGDFAKKLRGKGGFIVKYPGTDLNYLYPDVIKYLDRGNERGSQLPPPGKLKSS